MKRFLTALAFTALVVALCALSASAEIIYGRQCPDASYHNTGMYRNDYGHYLYCYDCEAPKGGDDYQPHVRREATCQSKAVCSVCGWQLSDTLGDHNYVATGEIEEASCNRPQRQHFKCSVCQESITKTYGNPLGHQFGEYRLKSPATCDSNRVYEARCVRYGQDGCRAVDLSEAEGTSLGHMFFSKDAVSNHNATCDSDGTKTAKCIRYGTGGCTRTCDYPDPGSALGHAFREEDYISNHDATCDSDGTKTAKCIRYGIGGCTATNTLPDPGSALGHLFREEDYVSNGDATCDNDGTKTAKCMRYGTGGCTATNTLPDSGSALGHEFKDENYFSNKDATCDSGGTKTAKCARYGTGGCVATNTLPDEGSALGHEFRNEDYISNSDATCERDGTKTAKCVRYGIGGCEKTDTHPDEGSALRHLIVYDEGYAPTCTKPGLTDGIHCGRSRCRKILTPQTVIAPSGHSYASVVTKPTCTSGGFTTYTCSICRDSYILDETEPLNHIFGQWTPIESDLHLARCTREDCGYTSRITCESVEFRLPNTEEVLTVCPVCGAVSDGSRLELLAPTLQETDGWIPRGGAAVHLGMLDSGAVLLTVGFEEGGRLTQPEGLVTFTLPAAALDGFSLTILTDDAQEPLPYSIGQETANLTLNFTPRENEPAVPARVLLLTAESRETLKEASEKGQ